MAGIAPHLLRDTGRWLAVVVLALAALPSAAVATTATGPQVTVMTRNLFLGSGLSNLVGVDGPAELTAAVGEGLGRRAGQRFPTRRPRSPTRSPGRGRTSSACRRSRLWRDSPSSDLREHPGPNATHVVFDHLELLTAALTARGTPYSPVASSTTDDFEVIRRDGDALTDLRITDRDVLLVRADRLDSVVGARTGHYGIRSGLGAGRWPSRRGRPARRVPRRRPVPGVDDRRPPRTGRPAGLLDDVTDFARRRPIVFLAAAGAAGFVVGRLARAGRAVQQDDGDAADDPAPSTRDRAGGAGRVADPFAELPPPTPVVDGPLVTTVP